MSDQERWEPGDVVLAADQTLWWRSAIIPSDPPWRIVNSNSYHSEDTPVHPLKLLVRGGQLVGDQRGQLINWAARVVRLAYQIENETDHASAIELAGEIRQAADSLVEEQAR